MPSPMELLLRLLAEVVKLIGSILPRLPESVRSLAAKIGQSLVSVLSGVPYIELVPWDAVGIALAVIPIVWVWSIGVRTAMRVWAWIRSRGTADY